MEEEILRHLNSYNFDIRITKDARFMDQKVTPDVLCIIADCVLQFIGDDNDIEFTTKQIWTSDYANDNIKDIFSKPDVLEETADSEYDKFFAQPLKMLAYSKILKCEVKSGRNFFKINNETLLNFISIKEKNAIIFLNKYLEKVLSDSGLWSIFNDFFENNNKHYFNILKNGYEDFILEHTPIRGRVEIRRIFSKIINPMSFVRGLHGTKRGFYSNDVISYDELMYNRKNWRDVDKLKGETRQEQVARLGRIEKSKLAFINIAKNKIRRHHSPDSELRDAYSAGTATQVHHIFPLNNFPQLGDILENLILLTGTQHSAYAHPNNNTRLINKEYQLSCLLAKSSSVKISVDENDGFYSKTDFVYVLNEGINPDSKFLDSCSFSEIEFKLVDEYNRC